MEVAARTKKLVPFNEEKPLSNKFRITVEPIGFLFFIAVCIQVLYSTSMIHLFLVAQICFIVYLFTGYNKPKFFTQQSLPNQLQFKCRFLRC